LFAVVFGVSGGLERCPLLLLAQTGSSGPLEHQGVASHLTLTWICCQTCFSFFVTNQSDKGWIFVICFCVFQCLVWKLLKKNLIIWKQLI